MTDESKLGEPIPRDIVTADTAVLGEEPKVQATEPAVNAETALVAAQIAALKQEIATLKSRIASVGDSGAASSEAHPFILATVLSLGAWALIIMTYRRSR